LDLVTGNFFFAGQAVGWAEAAVKMEGFAANVISVLLEISPWRR